MGVVLAELKNSVFTDNINNNTSLNKKSWLGLYKYF